MKFVRSASPKSMDSCDISVIAIKEVNDGGAKASSSPFTSEHAAVVDGVLYSVGAIGLAFGLASLLVLLIGQNPLDVLGVLIRGAFNLDTGLPSTLYNAHH